MRGLMMDVPLLISTLIESAAEKHAQTEIVSNTVEGGIHRYTYADAHRRSKQLANALKGLGVTEGMRCGTLAWNGYRHFEIYYGVSGMGAVCHTINPRLFPPQIAYIVGHAEDEVLFTDLTFVPLLDALKDHLKPVKHIVIMTDEAHMPETSLPNAVCYETLINGHSDDFAWPKLDEYAASSLCYTSGTTGNPKGVLYSNRSTVLHSYTVCLPDSIGLSSRDCIMPVVPMFHVNAWGFPYAAAMAGSKVVMPGMGMDGKSMQELIESENVTQSAGVPTLWLGLLAYLRESGKKIESLQKIVIGGSATPKAMTEEFEKVHGVEVIHAWGMTEMSPIGTANQPKYGMEDETIDQRIDRQVKQGRAVYAVDMQIVDDQGKKLPHDGKAFGDLRVRGPAVCSAYYNDTSDAHGADGWFSTGDVATIDEAGYMYITDRSKDVIKSGGEWISSIELENIAVGHPEVTEAACIGVAHPKWDERPLLVVIRNEGSSLSREDMLAYFDDKVAKWWIPDDVAFVDELPHTATGKLLKMKLREDFKGHELPTAADG